MPSAADATENNAFQGDHAEGTVRCILPPRKAIRTVKKLDSQNSISFKFPGRGKPYPNCGTWKTTIGCVDHHTVRYPFHHSCKRMECPVCKDEAYERVAKRISEKVMKAEFLYRQEGFYLGDIRHIVLSPPQDKALDLLASGNDDVYKTLRTSAKYRMEQLGAKGFLMIFHHRRISKSGRSYPSPHFHVLGYGWLIDSKEFYDSTGWVYKNKGQRDSLTDTIIYLLSHCGLVYDADGEQRRKIDSYTYYGLLSSQYVIKDGPPIKTEETVECPVKGCKKKLRHFFFNEEPGETYYKQTSYQNYKLRRHAIIQARLDNPFKKKPPPKDVI